MRRLNEYRASMARRSRIGSLLGSLAILALVGCSRTAPTVAVTRDIVAYLRLEGTAVAPPTAVSTIYPPYQTTVKKVDATLHERVHRGDRLIELVIPSADE